MRTTIERLCDKYGLGSLHRAPETVTGGLMHTMYRVCTDSGEYAIKVLNSDIMKRPAAFQNMVNSEIVAQKLKDIIPLACARTFDGNSLIEFEGHCCIIFDWVEGASIFSPNISTYHCEQIGQILGKIHAADISIDGMDRKSKSCKTYVWNELMDKAEYENAECFAILKDNMLDLASWSKRVANSWDEVSKSQVISHRDLDPKNVMWKNDKPIVIDWEAAGFINPAQELIEVINYWAADEAGEYSREKVIAIMKSYSQSMNVSKVNVSAMLDCSFKSMLGWLEYNVKRALGMNGISAKERQEGMKEVFDTIGKLKHHEKQIDKLGIWIREYFSSL